MSRILMVYGTTEGQTEHIVDVMASVAREAGHDVVTADVIGFGADWPEPRPEAVLVAGSVHAGRHPEALGRFVHSHRHRLEAVPTAFLSVSLSAAGDEAKRHEAETYVQTFLQETEWHPTMAGAVGGALRYSRYGFVKRVVMKQIAKSTGLPTDTSHDHELTDWAEVAHFAEEFYRLAGSPPEKALQG
jgi:menaquinone-dependent protoporphyrinogen oxidase